MKIYHDACCLNRPFDDQSQDRIRLESEAIFIIMNTYINGYWEWIAKQRVKMNVQEMTDYQIRNAGLDILARELGPVGMLRFMQQFEHGQGDYTEERHTWLTETDVQTLADKILRRREGK